MKIGLQVQEVDMKKALQNQTASSPSHITAIFVKIKMNAVKTEYVFLQNHLQMNIHYTVNSSQVD